MQKKLNLGAASLNLLDISPIVLFNLLWWFEHIAGNFKEENSVCVDCEEACFCLMLLALMSLSVRDVLTNFSGRSRQGNNFS